MPVLSNITYTIRRHAKTGLFGRPGRFVHTSMITRIL